MRVAAFFALVTTISVAAEVRPPAPSDPELARMYSQAVAELTHFAKAGFPKGSSTPWPCNINEKQLRSFAGSLGADELSDIERRNAKRMNLDAGMGMNEGVLAVREIQIVPVKAQCTEGRLDGDLVYLVTHLQKIVFAGFDQQARVTKLVKVTLHLGEIVLGSNIQVTAQEMQRTVTWHDPDVQKMMKNQKKTEPDVVISMSIRRYGDGGPRVSLSQARSGSAGNFDGAFFAWSPGPGLRQENIFTGENLALVYRYKNDRLHGLQEVAAVKVNGQIVIPAEQKCFENGEEIKTRSCDVD